MKTRKKTVVGNQEKVRKIVYKRPHSSTDLVAAE